MKKKIIGEKVVIYQAKSGAIELRGDFGKETVWATQAQIAEVFSIDRTVVTKHIGNILKLKEVNEKSNVQKMHIANSDKLVTFYSLDIILAVGYRTNSAKAILFRRWASNILRKHLIDGYTINRSRVAKNYEEFQKVIESIKHLLPSANIDNTNVLELISAFTDTWFSLETYDKDKLVIKGSTKKAVILTAEHLGTILVDFKKSLIKKTEATNLFGQERIEGSVAGIVGNVMQSFGGKELYPTVEEKAAHILYFMVKNHPFVDGNKRSGAFVFVWFLRQGKILNISKLTPPALTALTIMVAESNPKYKDRIIGLILQLLKK